MPKINVTYSSTDEKNIKNVIDGLIKAHEHSDKKDKEKTTEK